MPEYRPEKRRTLTDEQLYQQYHSESSKRDVKKRKKKKKKGSSVREAPPVSPQRRRMQEQARQREIAERGEDYSKRRSSSSDKTKKKTRKKRGSYILYYVLAGIAATAVLCILSVTVLFNISSFEIVGDTVYTDQQIISASGISEGDNLLRINIGKAQEDITSQLVNIDSAVISRAFPNRLVITVEAAKPKAAFYSLGKYYLMSERGRLLGTSDNLPDCPVIRGFSPDTSAQEGAVLEDDEEKRIDIARQIIDTMAENSLASSCEINLADPLDITVKYDGRIEMHIGAITQLDIKIEYAAQLIGTEILENEQCELILSNPDRVVKRPVHSTEAPVTTPAEDGTDDDTGEEPGDDTTAEE